MSYIKTLAEQLGTEASSGILGMVLGGINDRRQVSQQHRLTDIQIEAQKNLSQFNMAQQLEMWKNTSYPAQIEQMKKAGLNPALLYGMGGGGGQTTGNTSANVTGATAQQNPGEVQQMVGMGLQNGLLAEQRKLIQAQTKNVNADTASKQKQPANIEADTAMKIANTGNIQQDTKLKEIATHINQLQAYMQKETIEDQIHIIEQQAARMDEDVMQMAIKTNMDRATQKDKIDIVHQELMRIILENALTKAQTAKTGQETSLLSKENKYYIERFTAELSRISHQNYADIHNTGAAESQAQTAAIKQAWEQFLHDIPDAEKIPMDLMEKAAQVLFLKQILQKNGVNPIKGFHNR